MLLRRYSFLIDHVPTAPVNVIEKAVDLHAVRVIGSSGYQKCIQYLWRGWLVQSEDDPAVFVDYKDKDNPNFLVHMDPDRMRAPRYQNAAQLLFSIIYLALYTAAINSINPTGVLDGAEVALYIFTFGYVCDEVVKFYKAGYHILGFWNAFNGTLYTFLAVSLVLRIIGLTYPNDVKEHEHYNQLSYNFLAFVAPLFWGRLLLYFDSFRFFGAMLVVLKVMMRESIIFFALLGIIIVGFLQAFIGLDLADDLVPGDAWFIVESMLKAIMQSPEFDGFENFGPPFGLILYYCFTFVVMVRSVPIVRARASFETNKHRSFFSTSSLRCTTLHMRTSTTMLTTSTWRSLPRRRCSLFERLMRMFTLLRLISLKSSSPVSSSGGCPSKRMSFLMIVSWAFCTRRCSSWLLGWRLVQRAESE